MYSMATMVNSRVLESILNGLTIQKLIMLNNVILESFYHIYMCQIITSCSLNLPKCYASQLFLNKVENTFDLFGHKYFFKKF